MPSDSLVVNPEYQSLLQHVGETLENGRAKVVEAVNTAAVSTYWEIGRDIVEFEQGGNAKAEYGSKLLKKLSRDLTDLYGSGFSMSNVAKMRKLYLTYPILQTASAKLSWSHYVELLKIDDPLERSFYEKEAESEHWGVRELKRQMKSMLFHRLALSTNREEVLRLAKEGEIIERPEDILREPYVFEFTGLPQLPVYTEGDLEEALVNNLSLFFLELGKGFTYVGRQQKMVIGGRTYKVDLVFYHRILKCFVLIDLKRGEVQHEDIGQMNFYLNYYREEMNTEGDTEPIGIVLGAYRDKLVMQYALQNISNQVFVSRYQLYFPDREQLEAEFRRYMGDHVSEELPE
jgi:predicted nuclease of restriction endonuclease-like (RecB) superfamily